MKAVVIDKCCKAEDLHVTNIPEPEVRPGWVLVKVHAAGLNHSEVILRQYEADEDYINTPVVPGIECVGEIADPSDSDFKKGERVVGLMGGMGRSFNGSYEEYVLLPVNHVFKVDLDLDWIDLAAIPESYFTAYGSMTQSLLLKEGDTLLVRGATSTVGQAAIQLAKAMGATVIGTSRRETSFDKLFNIGADYCIVDDGEINRQKLQKQPNKILELVGLKTLRDSMLTVSHPGFVCITGILGNVFSYKNFSPIGFIPNGTFLSAFHSNFPTQKIMDEIFSIIKNNHLKPLYSKVFKLEDIVEAHRLLEEGTAGGKIILKISD